MNTVSAFANYRSGRILFGVTDERKEVGVDNPVQSCLDIENKINDSISSRPNYELRIDNNNVIQLFVEKGENQPYLYKGKAYRRNDSSSIEVDAIELRRMVLEGVNLSFDELTSKRAEFTFFAL